MRISEAQYYELIDAVVREGDPTLIVAPLSSTPAEVPAGWAQLLTSPDPRAAIATLWRPVADRVPRIYRGLQERLHGVGLLRTDEIPASLLYFFSDGDEWIPFRGRPPLEERALRRSPLPKEFLEFYRIHDGWVHHHSEDSGPLPSAGWSPVSTLWSEVVWKVPPGEESYETAIAVYRDSDDFALAYDTSASPALPLRCYGDGTVDVLLDMWAAVDREIGELLEELDWSATASGRRGRFRADASSTHVSRYQELIARAAECHTLAAHLGGGSADEQAADLLLNCARLEREGAGDRDKIVGYYGQALRHWCASIDLRWRCRPGRGAGLVRRRSRIGRCTNRPLHSGSTDLDLGRRLTRGITGPHAVLSVPRGCRERVSVCRGAPGCDLRRRVGA